MVACEARPTAPQAVEVAPPVVEVATPVVVPPAPAELPAVVVASPPAPPLAPGQIAMHPILRHRSSVAVTPDLRLLGEPPEVTASMAGLLDDQVVFVLEEQFVVFPTGAAADAAAPPDLAKALPTDGREKLVIREESDDEGASDLQDHRTLTAIGGRWPGAMYATIDTGNTRSYSLPEVFRWDGDAWEGVPGAVYKSEDVELEIAWGYLRLLPWVDGGMLGVRGLVCGTDLIHSCEDGVLELDPKSEFAPLAAKVKAVYAEFKPLVVVDGRATALPTLPRGGDTSRIHATASGDIFVPRAGAVERWSVATGRWRSLPLADAAAIPTLYGRDPAHLYALTCSGEVGGLAQLDGEAFRAVESPPGACLHELSIERGGAVWALQGAPGEIGAAEPPRTALWRRPVGGAWERLTIVPAPITADSDGRWSSDGLRWTRDPPASQPQHVVPFAVVAIGPGDVFVHAKVVETGDMVVLRDRPLPAATIDLAPTQIAEYRLDSGDDGCLPQQLVLRSFDRRVDIAEVWPQALAEVARTPGGRLFEVPGAGDTWQLVAMIDGPPHDIAAKKVLLHGLRGRLLTDGADLDAPSCGLPGTPRRELVAPKKP